MSKHYENGVLLEGVAPGFVEATDSEIATFNTAQAIRFNKDERNNLLLETDFYALADVTMTDAMTAYRQALRDLPDHSNWPNLESGDWPTKP